MITTKKGAQEYADDFFRKFDNLRNACILNNDNIDRLYGLYLGKLLEVTPENYHKIYFELMNQDKEYPVCLVD